MTEATAATGWGRQIARRDAEARAFVDRAADALNAGDFDAAEAMFRRSAFASVTAGWHLLNAMLVDRTSARGDGLVSVDRPATLIALAISRLQTAGDLGGLDKLLLIAAERLRSRKAPHPAERARDLSLAALCCQLRHDIAGGTTIAARGTEFVLELGEAVLPDAEPDDLLIAAVCDLALAAFLIGDAPRAAGLWLWIRDTVGDPRVPALMQADWGLAIVGTVIGVRDLVSPTMRRYFADMRGAPNVAPEHEDPWWGMVVTARAWTELDRLEPERALDLTRVGVASITMSQVVGPLILAHAFALVASGRPMRHSNFCAQRPPSSPAHRRRRRGSGVRWCTSSRARWSETMRRSPKRRGCWSWSPCRRR